MNTHQAVDTAARESYGRLVAFLAARSGDLASAEDALADAFVAALEVWPRQGVPEKPEAWLLTAARRRLLDRARHAQVQERALPDLASLSDAAVEAENEMEFPDERLKLLFVCAHPAIDASMRTPLMLQTVLGLDAEAISSAFLIQPAAMGQRLSRAKTKIRLARIPFTVPEESELPARLHAVLEAIYAGYGRAWDDAGENDPKRAGLGEMCVELAFLLLNLLPGEAEIHGLASLLLHCEARSAARFGPGGEFVTLGEQDVRLWSRERIAAADRHLAIASRLQKLGPFQLEAAIQSVHNDRLRVGITDWQAVAQLYEALVRIAPTVGARVSRAAAMGEAFGAEVGLEELQRIPEGMVRNYQPYWAAAAHLNHELARTEDAARAYERAIELTANKASSAYLEGKLQLLSG